MSGEPRTIRFDLKKESHELGIRIKRLRLKQNLSAEEAARQIGVSSSTYRDWESGRPIKGEPYLRICTVLKCSLLDLFGLSTGREMAISNEVRKIESALATIRLLI